MAPPESELALRGREIIATGQLRLLRQRLGLTRSAMAELLHISPLTYTSWEMRSEEALGPPTGEEDEIKPVRPWAATAERVARFYDQALVELDILAEHGIELYKMVPFYMAATYLGLPQELMLKRYRDGQFEAIDAGILGLWVRRDQLPLRDPVAE